MFTNKYALLVLINLPLLLIGIVSAIMSYKANPPRASKKRAVIEVIFWLFVGAALVAVEPIYNALIKHNLTNSQPMSIFDMVLLSIVLLCLFLIKQANERISILSKKLSRLHENLVIAEEQRHWDKDK